MKMPPLGLRPEIICIAERRQEIKEAIERFLEAGNSVPPEWIEEDKALCVRYEIADNNFRAQLKRARLEADSTTEKQRG